jgi:sec-independent protein translocase protein TatC
MARVIRPIGHDERLSIVDHLDELRSRLFVCGAALLVAFGLCFWQNQGLLRLLNHPLPKAASASHNHLNGLTGDTASARKGLEQVAAAAAALARSSHQSAADRTRFSQLADGARGAATALPSANPQQVPITIGVAEPFTTTLTVVFYAALILSLPVLLYQLYAFVLPALNHRERRIALPVMGAAPALFVVGVVFAYVVVLGPAIHFLQGYNSKNFNALVAAKQLYSFEIMTMLGIGLAFQLPLVLVGLDWVGAITSSTLIRHWRYAVVIIAVIVAALPGPDLVTSTLEMIPLVLLYALSIVLLKVVDRRRAAREADEMAALDNTLDNSLDPTG